MHYDSPGRQLLVSAGNGISFLSLADGRRTAEVDLPGHPEGFAVEQRGTRVFVNVPVPSKKMFVVDRVGKSIHAQWALGGALANMFSNFPMSLDEEHGRLFVGTRVAASLKVLDDTTGRVVADLKTDGDDDDIFYDATRRLVYASCGAGFVDVFRQADADYYELLARVPTAEGARTSLWVPEMDRLFVAIPRRGGQPAEVRVFEAQ